MQQTTTTIDLVAFAYDFGARMYDARIGRWMKPDDYEKLAPAWTPYRFGLDNPILNIDKGGNLDVSVHIQECYPLTALILQNADKIYFNEQLPSDVAKVLNGIDVNKIFNDGSEYVGKTIREFKERIGDHFGKGGKFAGKANEVKEIVYQELEGVKRKALKFKEQEWIDDAIDRGLKLKDTLKNSINAARKKKQ